MGHATALFVTKTHRASSTGKRGEQGRFVTLKSGRVIFIPAGQRTKWADVRERVLASQKKPLYESVKGMAIKGGRLTGEQSGIERSFVNTYEDGTKVLVKQNEIGSADSELMAYEFSESIGWGIVPETIVPRIGRFADNESVQRWVEGKSPIAPGARRSFETGFKVDPRMLLMDILLQNVDRHAGNVLVDREGKQWAIDNNLAFSPFVATPLEGRWRPSYHLYGRIQRYAPWGEKLKGAAKDVARWSKTPVYKEYVNRLRDTIGENAAGQFVENIQIMADWF